MLHVRIPGTRKSEGRIKAEMAAVERQCESIVARFDALQRAPTAAEREARRLDFLAGRKRLGELGTELLALRCPYGAS
jgi:hypothetical protein